MDFSQPYHQDTFLKFLKDNFLPNDFKISKEIINLTDLTFNPDRIQKIELLGEVLSLDLKVYEIHHESENDPRVTLSKETFRIMAKYSTKKALILFYSKNSPNYRFSLATIDLKLEDTRVAKEYSNPRRYSFFLGPAAKTHTPEQYLENKGRIKNFDDLKNRFSIEIVNKEFYNKIAEVFTNLAGGSRKIGSKSINAGSGALKLPSTNDDILRKEFTVRLIGRLVFCWFLKKKHSDSNIPLLPEEVLSVNAINENKNYYHTILEPLFFEVLNTPINEREKKYEAIPWNQIPFLNGGLFNPHIHDFYEPGLLGISKHIGNLEIPDKLLKNLFEIFETYNFTIDENTSIDVELSIDPEMLGRVFENLLAEINPETGETARKSTGSYYTPRPIVEYMVAESLKQYLLTKTGLDEKKISELLIYQDENINLNNKEKEKIVDALDKIKIIDPACGSGAFPMGMLQKILLILQKVDPNSQKWFDKKLESIGDNTLQKDLKTKFKSDNFNYIHKIGIIRDAIYGVDIQPIAVEISKLRFFLSLIVDEKVNDIKENRGIEPLPNLEFKFVCANSLIGLPNKVKVPLGKTENKQPQLFKKEEQLDWFESDKDIKILKELRDEYLRSFGENKKKVEKKFQEVQTRMFKHSLSWGGRNSQTLKLSQWNPFSEEKCDWFDPDWMFGIKDGFGIVIANPPYIRQEDIKEYKPLLQKAGYQVYNSTSDLYTYFYELSYNILALNSFSCFISSNKWIRANYGEKLRNFLKAKTKVTNLIDFGGHKVFETAMVDTNILLFQKTKPQIEYTASYINIESDFTGENLDEYLHKKQQTIKQNELSDSGWTLADNKVLALKKKIEKIGIPLKNWDVKINRGIVIGFNEAFIIDTSTQKQLCTEDPKSVEIIKPILRGRDIDRYYYKWAGLWLIKIESGWTNKNRKSENAEKYFEKSYPGVYQHLVSFKKSTGKGKGLVKRDDQGDYWWELRDCDYYPEFEKEKIIYKDIADKLSFVNESGKYFLNNTTYFINTGNRYLLSVLNSSLLNFYYEQISSQLGNEVVRAFTIFIENLPIPKIFEQQQKPFIELIDKILANTKDDDYSTNSAKQAKVKEYECQIDQMVYKLYDLTDEEIKIVEKEVES